MLHKEKKNIEKVQSLDNNKEKVPKNEKLHIFLGSTDG